MSVAGSGLTPNDAHAMEPFQGFCPTGCAILPDTTPSEQKEEQAQAKPNGQTDPYQALQQFYVPKKIQPVGGVTIDILRPPDLVAIAVLRF